MVFGEQHWNIRTLLSCFLKKCVWFFKSLFLLDVCLNWITFIGLKLMTSLKKLEKTLQNLSKKTEMPFLVLINHSELLLQLYQDWKFSHKSLPSVKYENEFIQLETLIWFSFILNNLIWKSGQYEFNLW